MATIPRSQGPRVMPGAARPVQYTGAESGVGVGRAIEQLGNTGMQIAVDMRNDQLRVEQAELRQRQVEQEKVDRSNASLKLGLGREALRGAAADLADRVLRGELTEEAANAEWQTASADVQSTYTEGMKPSTSVTADKADIAKEIDKVAWPTTKARDAATEAAYLVYDGLRDQKGNGSRRKALEIATGGGLTEWGDRMVPLPPGWSESRFRSSMRTLSPADLTRQAPNGLFIGSTQVAPEALLRSLPSATLIPYGPGTYAIDAGGVVTVDKRKPFVLKLGD